MTDAPEARPALAAYPAAVVRAAEEPLLAAGAPLMAIAARAVELAVVRELRQRRTVPGARVVVLVGSGNNGGDGLFAAAGLARRGASVQVLLASAHPHPDGLAAASATQARIAGLAGLADPEIDAASAQACAGADVVVDAVAGTGITGALRGAAAAVIAGAHRGVTSAPRPVAVVAVDVPSGIGVDDGALPPAVLPATVTVTMGAAKPGLLAPPASAVAGRIEVVDLGLDLTGARPTVVRPGGADVAATWPVPAARDHKYSRGVLGVLAGSDRYPGAAVLAVAAAVPLTGMVRYLGGVTGAVLARSPEAVPGRGRVQAWTLGPGIGTDDDARLGELAIVLREAAGNVPVVVDAGGLSALGERLPASVVLTPHAGELARLLTQRGHRLTREEVVASPVQALRLAVEATGASVLLKGSTTLVAGPGTPVFSVTGAPGWLATAGAGDVLAGILGALLAGCSERVMADPAEAARLAAAAAQVHGCAAGLASTAHGPGPGGPISALDVAEAIPAALRILLAGR